MSEQQHEQTAGPEASPQRPQPHRRHLLQAAAGIGAAGAAGSATAAQAVPARPAPTPRRDRGAIDVHAHYLPADYRQALVDHGVTAPDGFPVLPTWSPESHLQMMDRVGIATAMLSVSSPGVAFGGDEIDWARSVNETGAKAVRDHPGRFGLLATLPLPDVDASLREITHAFDVLHADGVVLKTHFAGIYLGDEHYAPVYAELNRRKTVVLIHPTSPACLEETSLGYPRPLLEFILDTTRAVSDLILSGTLDRYPDMRIIVCHAGAALPVVADRLAGFSELFPVGGYDKGQADVIGALQKLHYEVGAGFPFPRHVKALLELVDPEQLLYGTDFPFGGVPGIEASKQELERTRLLNRPQRDGVMRGNAEALFPRLRAR